MFAQWFKLSTTYAITVTDQDNLGGHTVTINPSGTQYYRIFLGPTGASGATQFAAIEFLAYLEGLLGVRWTVRLTTGGTVVITYLGSGTGTINWGTGAGSGEAIKVMLGYSSTSFSLSTNGTKYADR